MPLPRKLFLRPLSKAHPDLALPHAKPLIIGRSPQTKIKDSKLSKQHLELTANTELKKVKIKVLGSNPSVIDNEKLGKGASKIASVGDEVELLEGKYKYVIKMEEGQENIKTDTNGKVPDKKPLTPQKTFKMPPAQPANHHWSQGLLAAMNDPALVLRDSGRAVVIKDKYPKAKFHYLVLPKDRIPDLKSLVGSEHIDLIEHLYDLGKEMADLNPEAEFRFGYHAIPSMSQVHLHVISQDFDSPCLKNKKHWNSFTTEYFVSSDKVIRELKIEGEVSTLSAKEGKELLAKDLMCHKCDYKPKNLPDLKKHLKTHFP